MKTRRQAFAILLLLTYIDTCSKYAYSYYDNTHFSHFAPRPPDTPTNTEQELQLAGWLPLSKAFVKESAELAAKLAEAEATNAAKKGPGKRLLPVPDDSLNVPRNRLDLDAPHNVIPTLVHKQADVTAEAITAIADWVKHNTRLTRMLEDIGYSPPRTEWKQFPTKTQLETAYFAAEHAGKGGGKAVLVSMVHLLREIYESVASDPALKDFLVIQPTRPIKFTFAFDESDLVSPTSVRLPGEISETIDAILKYCDHPCTVLGGMRGILINYLLLKPDVADTILRTSKSNRHAFERGFSQLELSDAMERTKRIINRLQDTYEPARHIRAFNDVNALPTPYNLTTREAEVFRSSLRAEIEEPSARTGSYSALQFLMRQSK